jgi:hypothetical protein
VYWPLVEMLPAPAFTSPPLTDQLTEAAPPPLRVAENCSMADPEVLTALQPVQLVSMVAEPGETEKVLLDEVPDADPPQPASKTKTGTAPAANSRAGQRRSNFVPCRCERQSPRLPSEGKPGIRGSVVAAVPLLKLPGAFLANVPAQPLLDVVRSYC